MNDATPGDSRWLRIIAENIRKQILQVIFNSKSGHTGGSLSAVDILTVLYFKVLNVDPENPGMAGRDRFILSKGHSVEACYCVLAERGFFPKAWLDSYGKFKSPLAGHPVNSVPGIEVNTGALGHGLSIGTGMAIAAKMNNSPYRTYVLMGDGEQNEGSVYEAAMAASHYKLDNLIAITDRNRLQISGYTENVMKLERLAERWQAFGWNVIETNGNCVEKLLDVFLNGIPGNGYPTMIIAETVKGKGISFIENKAEWHHKVPSEEELQMAINELDNRIFQLTSGTK
ncbi:MAG: transketolase [Bacteroidales bacterium]